MRTPFRYACLTFAFYIMVYRNPNWTMLRCMARQYALLELQGDRWSVSRFAAALEVARLLGHINRLLAQGIEHVR